MEKKITSLRDQPLGAHLSIGAGFKKMIQDGESIDCTAIALFLHSNRQWAMKALSSQAIDVFKETAKDSTVRSFVVHASYLINLGSVKSEIRKKSIDMLAKELYQCDQLGIKLLVLHPGSYSGSTLNESIEKIAEGIDEAIAQRNTQCMVLIENMAGQGSSVGSRLEELAAIREKAQHKAHIGFCFDTCHGFAAGYDFTTPAAYEAFWKQFDAVIGYDQLKAFHLNDSKKDLGSRVDRHEQIGKGKIGLEAFRLLVNDKKLMHIPKVLETPYTKYSIDALKLYSENLRLLRSLIEG